MRSYCHTQHGTVIVVAVGIAIAMTLGIGVASLHGPPVVPLVLVPTLVLLVACLALFGSLTVEIGDGRLSLRFGPGLIHKSFELGEIRSAKAVRNPWWYGWGIRFTPHGWLFNVSGLEAVEIALVDGRTYRIGTDEPLRLAAAIRDAVPLGAAGTEPEAGA